MRCETEPIRILSESSQNPMKSDRDPRNDPTDGSVVLDPIGSYGTL